FQGELSGLVPSSDSERAGEALRTEQPSGAYLANLEAIAVESGECLQTGLHAASPIAVVSPEREIPALARRQSGGHAVGRVVVPGKKAENCRIHEDRRVEEPADCRNVERRIL